ncbi:MAG: citrate synthase [Phenylobacterium sp.]|uniref:citrate synthase n=1 Tax=Phenylobacterium sp. TaxID=1871053 RepID=UPI001B7936B5|nr:citrate synthase [Phenylobacterium sp.]MBP7816683.1 citrate synthase [Phenylobacterium sp.]MBP9231032.1 citrate synthase [Phenylobacterium sp.]MBP9756752.1 citrate synthase [Phenylobacterium sp.]
MPQTRVSDWIGADEARERLGVRPQTLYAYVSRGRVQTRIDPGDPRRSLYRAADITALVQRKTRSRKASEVAAGAIAWGEPVLVSAITTISQGRLFYRGRDAVELAETETLESVARLLRGGHGAALKRTDRPRPPEGDDMTARAFLALAARAGVDAPALGRHPLALAVEAATLLDVLTDAIAGEVGGGAIHNRLALAWGLGPGGPGADLVRRVLVLLADHELNPSAFAARVAASTGASLSAAALAGLATLSGPRHGGAPAAIRAFAAEAASRGARAVIAARLAEDRLLPGFGHQLYPDHDPRAAALLERFKLTPEMAGLRAAAEEITGLQPNIDFALVAMSDALKLPKDAPFALFATARCAGWIAHAIEQGQTGALIRPRARYVGVEVA